MGGNLSFVRVNGIRVAYRFDGPDNAPVVTMSHGLLADYRMWDPQADALKARFRVLRYDIRGHGASDAPDGPYSFEVLDDDLVQMLDALAVTRTHFLGHSIGGMIGQRFAACHPDRIGRLVLAGTSATTPVASAWQGWLETIRREGMRGLVESMLDRWFDEDFRAAHPEAVARVADAVRASPAAGFVGSAHTIMALDHMPLLPKIKAPTLIIVGAETRSASVEDGEAMRKAIPNARMVVLPNARHFANIEQAAAFNRALLDFLGA
ncbi:MAG: alpha/beta fold hydrolase [Alphaproteobacteria bacterium]